ncbi:MAG: hypothetical protein JJV96_00675 [Alphaproteobacteria bacterium]|nr:hypothetical protein [Alphaproteobacteria bacterium]
MSKEIQIKKRIYLAIMRQIHSARSMEEFIDKTQPYVIYKVAEVLFKYDEENGTNILEKNAKKMIDGCDIFHLPLLIKVLSEYDMKMGTEILPRHIKKIADNSCTIYQVELIKIFTEYDKNRGTNLTNQITYFDNKIVLTMMNLWWKLKKMYNDKNESTVDKDRVL